MEQQYGPYASPPPSYGYPPPAPSTNGLAIASLVFSLLGLVGVPCSILASLSHSFCIASAFPLLGTFFGLIFGYSALNQISRSRGTQGGEGLAKAGIIIGWVTIGLWALGICVSCALWSDLESLPQGY